MSDLRVEPGCAYENYFGDRQLIWGWCRDTEVDGHAVLWSLGGDWYIPDGRMVNYRQVKGDDGTGAQWERFISESRGGKDLRQRVPWPENGPWWTRRMNPDRDEGWTGWVPAQRPDQSDEDYEEKCRLSDEVVAKHWPQDLLRRRIFRGTEK